MVVGEGPEFRERGGGRERERTRDLQETVGAEIAGSTILDYVLPMAPSPEFIFTKK